MPSAGVAGDPAFFAFLRGVGVFKGVWAEARVRLFRRTGVAVVEKLSTSSVGRDGVGRDFWEVLRVRGIVMGRRWGRIWDARVGRTWDLQVVNCL